MKQTYIVDGVRTPIGKFKGTLAAVRTDDLAAMTIAKPVSYTHLTLPTKRIV